MFRSIRVRRRNRIILVSVLLATSGFSIVAGAESLTLDDAIQHALNHNRSILLANLLISEAEIEVMNREADFSFRMSPEGFVGTDSSEQETASTGLRASRRFTSGTTVDASTGYRFADEDGAFVRFNINQPLFRRAGRLVNLEPLVQAQLNVVEAQRTLYLREQDLIVDVAVSYESVLQLINQVEADREAVKRLGRLTELTQAREEAGTAMRIDTLRVDFQLGAARSRLENSTELLALEKESFCDLIGETNDCSFVFIPPPLMDIQPPDYDAAVAIALSNRLDYAKALQAVRNAERGSRIAKKGLSPDISVLGQYERSGRESNDRDAFDFKDETWFAGLSLEPDLNRYDRRATYLLSLSLADRRNVERVDLEYEIAREVKQQIRAYKRAGTDYLIAKRNSDLARKRWILSQEMYELGKADNFTATDAEDSFSSAQTAELRTRAEASVSSYRLLRALGTLIEIPDELKPEK